jgi:hypothetical protein
MEVAAIGIISGIRASIKKKFKKLNALSESAAVTLEELRLEKREISMFETLLKRVELRRLLMDDTIGQQKTAKGCL